MTPGQVAIVRARKRPVEVEVVQLTDDDACDWDGIARWCGGRIYNIETSPGAEPETRIDITTLEGTMTAREGWWIIKGVKGEFHPVRPDIFEATYEPAAMAVREPDAADGPHFCTSAIGCADCALSAAVLAEVEAAADAAAGGEDPECERHADAILALTALAAREPDAADVTTVTRLGYALAALQHVVSSTFEGTPAGDAARHALSADELIRDRSPQRPEPQPAPELADDDENLTGHATVRFQAPVVAAARRLAAAEGMTVSDWIRREVEREAARREQPAPELARTREEAGALRRKLDIAGGALMQLTTALYQPEARAAASQALEAMDRVTVTGTADGEDL